jgi:restriction endonuclease S subunit
MVQQGIALWRVREIPLPVFSIPFQDKIASIIKISKRLKDQAKTTYSQAETLLLQSIGLKDYKQSTEAVNIKSFKDSFGTSGRLDAEYYQKKYEEVMNHIVTQSHASLIDIVSINKSIEPGSDVYSDVGLPFLRVADYNKYGITEPDKKLSWDFCATNAELIKKLKPKKETILFSKDGSVGTAYMLRKDEELVTSGAILHLNVRNKKEIIPEYLTLALNSKIVKMQSERDAGGSIILHWRILEIENVVVPIIPIEKQKEIAGLVEESFRLKKQSEHLLEVAKKAVEKAIEEGEERAMEIINNEKLEILL